MMQEYKVIVTFSVSRASLQEHQTVTQVRASHATEALLVAAQMVAARGMWVTDTELDLERHTQ